MRTICTLFALLLPASRRLQPARPRLAENWPSRPVLVVSPYSPGNATDIVGRIVLDQVSQQLGQPFVIENRAGAGGVVGVASGRKGRS